MAAENAASLLQQQDFFKKSSHIACYSPFRNEFLTKPIIELIWHSKKHCYLPVLTPEKKLEFLSYERGDKLQLNQFSILEPCSGDVFEPKKLDVVLMPLIAFDKKGHRLGTGGGYYDKTFSFLKDEKVHKPLLIGLAFSVQETEDIPVEDWDIPLDGIMTEKAFIATRVHHYWQ